MSHGYPPLSKTKVFVDVELLLKNLKSSETDIGQWVHVIGYITSIPKLKGQREQLPSPPNVGVQALVLWPAGDLDIVSYEKSF